MKKMILIIVLFGVTFLISEVWEQSLLLKKSQESQRQQVLSNLSQAYFTIKDRDKNNAPLLKTDLDIFIQNSIETLKLKDRLESIVLITDKADAVKVSLIKLNKDEINDILNLIGDKYSNVTIKEVTIDIRQGWELRPQTPQGIKDNISYLSDMKIYLERL